MDGICYGTKDPDVSNTPVVDGKIKIGDKEISVDDIAACTTGTNDNGDKPSSSQPPSSSSPLPRVSNVALPIVAVSAAVVVANSLW